MRCMLDTMEQPGRGGGVTGSVESVIISLYFR